MGISNQEREFLEGRCEGAVGRISFDMIHLLKPGFSVGRGGNIVGNQNQDGWINGEKSPENSKRRGREKERSQRGYMISTLAVSLLPWINRDKTGSFLLFALSLLIDAPLRIPACST